MATEFRKELIDHLITSKRKNQASRLGKKEATGYPDGEDFDAAAEVLGGAFEIQQADCPEMGVLPYGDKEAPVIVRLLRHMVKDGAGVSQTHFDIDQLWDSAASGQPNVDPMNEETKNHLEEICFQKPEIKHKALATKARQI